MASAMPSMTMMRASYLARGDALHDYDARIVSCTGLQGTVGDQGMSWLQFMFDRLQQMRMPCPKNDDVNGDG
jgi:hypothetical protein